MAEEVINLGHARAERSGSARDWSVLDALETTLARVKSGGLKPSCIYIAMAEIGEDGNARLPFAAAGMSNALEQLGLLAGHLNERASDTE